MTMSEQESTPDDLTAHLDAPDVSDPEDDEWKDDDERPLTLIDPTSIQLNAFAENNAAQLGSLGANYVDTVLRLNLIQRHAPVDTRNPTPVYLYGRVHWVIRKLGVYESSYLCATCKV